MQSGLGYIPFPLAAWRRLPRKIKRLTVKFPFGLGTRDHGRGDGEEYECGAAPPWGLEAAAEPSRDLMKGERNSFHVYSDRWKSPDAPRAGG